MKDYYFVIFYNGFFGTRHFDYEADAREACETMFALTGKKWEVKKIVRG